MCAYIFLEYIKKKRRILCKHWLNTVGKWLCAYVLRLWVSGSSGGWHSMELLIYKKIISLDLSVKDVYRKIWCSQQNVRRGRERWAYVCKSIVCEGGEVGRGMRLQFLEYSVCVRTERRKAVQMYLIIINTFHWGFPPLAFVLLPQHKISCVSSTACMVFLKMPQRTSWNSCMNARTRTLTMKKTTKWPSSWASEEG